MFEDDKADLSKIDAKKPLYVDEFIHEAVVQVDEAGTVAAAATSGAVVTRSAPPIIRIDHPFLFFIRDKLTGALLFSGQVADPNVVD